MKYSILHISDIHKTQTVSYDALLQSLERDLRCYSENESIIKPSFIVISGDIIQGADSDEQIRNQYAEVEVFLNNLCQVFLNGNKEYIIIVPGNHDVNRCRSKVSMNVSSASKKDLYDAYFEGSCKIRWSWEDFQFYEIIDNDIYRSRFELFVEFYNHFYQGIRTYPEDPEHEAFVIRNDCYKVSFACFNSCHQLDHLCVSGSIPEEAVLSVGRKLNESYNSGYLNVAVWHHHFYGAPLSTNYMDRSFLTYLLNANVHIGLFGHQHYTQVAEEYKDLELRLDGNLQKLLLISSGSLFGGTKELGVRNNRQYNIIEIEQTNGKATVAINIREDKNPRPDNQIPFWNKKALQTPDNRIVSDIYLRRLSVDKQLLEIDKKVKQNNDYIEACDEIEKLEIDKTLKHTIWFNYLSNVQDPNYVFEHLTQINTIEEAILKITAAIKSENRNFQDAVLHDENIRRLNDSNINDLLKQINI